MIEMQKIFFFPQHISDFPSTNFRLQATRHNSERIRYLGRSFVEMVRNPKSQTRTNEFPNPLSSLSQTSLCYAMELTTSYKGTKAQASSDLLLVLQTCNQCAFFIHKSPLHHRYNTPPFHAGESKNLFFSQETIPHRVNTLIHRQFLVHLFSSHSLHQEKLPSTFHQELVFFLLVLCQGGQSHKLSNTNQAALPFMQSHEGIKQVINCTTNHTMLRKLGSAWLNQSI